MRAGAAALDGDPRGARHEALAQAFVEPLPIEGVRVSATEDPAGALGSHEGIPEIALVADLHGCEGCYRAERTGDGVVVHGDAPLGIQHGLEGAALDPCQREGPPTKCSMKVNRRT